MLEPSGPSKFVVEPKYDGVRVQVHIQRDAAGEVTCKVFSRTCEVPARAAAVSAAQLIWRYSAPAPLRAFVRPCASAQEYKGMRPLVQDLVASRAVPGPFSAVLDGELLPLSAQTGRQLPFRFVGRYLRDDPGEERVEEEEAGVTPSLVLFDCLQWNGECLMQVRARALPDAARTLRAASARCLLRHKRCLLHPARCHYRLLMLVA